MNISFPDRRNLIIFSIRFLSLLLKSSLTPKEELVLTSFLLLPQKYQTFPFTQQTRKLVRTNLSLSSTRFNNIISSLRKKKFISLQEDDYLSYHPLLQTVSSTNSLSISLNGKVTLWRLYFSPISLPLYPWGRCSLNPYSSSKVVFFLSIFPYLFCLQNICLRVIPDYAVYYL